MAKKELFTQVIQEHQGILYKITKLYTDQSENKSRKTSMMGKYQYNTSVWVIKISFPLKTLITTGKLTINKIKLK